MKLRNNFMLKVIVFLITSFVWVLPCWALSSGGNIVSTSVNNNQIEITYDWFVNYDGSYIDGTIDCSAPYCVFGPGLRSGKGPSGSLCDSGGICVGSSWAQERQTITVPRWTPWNEVYARFVTEIGFAGTVKKNLTSISNSANVAWGSLCVGFLRLPLSFTGEVSVLAPQTACGVVPPPDLQCDSMIPGLIDLGTVPTGVSRLSKTVQGAVSCSRNATFNASIGGGRWLLDSVPIQIFVNDIKLSETSKIVATGRQVELNLKIIAEGDFKRPGTYSAVIPLVIGYY